MLREDQNRYKRVAAQVNRVRALYSRIGEPLPADVIIDLHRCLGSALEAVDERNRSDRERTRKRARA